MFKFFFIVFVKVVKMDFNVFIRVNKVEKVGIVQCWQECKLVRLFRKSCLVVFVNVRDVRVLGFSIFISGLFLVVVRIYVFQKMYKNGYWSCIFDSQMWKQCRCQVIEGWVSCDIYIMDIVVKEIVVDLDRFI